MKKVCQLILLLSCCVFTQAQSNKDSLRKVIQTNRPYEQQINASLQLVESYLNKDFDSTIIEGDKALKLARKHTDSISVAQIKSQIGVANYFTGKYDVAAKNFIESITILELAKEKKKLAPVYNELAKLYRKTRDLDKAMENYNKAGSIYQQLKDTAGIAMAIRQAIIR